MDRETALLCLGAIYDSKVFAANKQRSETALRLKLP